MKFGPNLEAVEGVYSLEVEEAEDMKVNTKNEFKVARRRQLLIRARFTANTSLGFSTGQHLLLIPRIETGLEIYSNRECLAS